MKARVLNTPGNEHSPASGFILVVVLWIVSLVAAVAVAFVLVVRSHSLSSANRVNMQKAELAADGLARLAAYRMAAAAQPEAIYGLDGAAVHCRWDGDAMSSIAVQDAGGLVDLNTGSPGLLRALLLAVVKDHREADALFAALQDFRDADSVAQSGGTEPLFYPGRGYGPKNGPLAVPEELDQVPGMNEDLFRALVPFATTVSQQPGIDLARAPASLLSLLGEDAERFQSPTPGRVFRIDVMVELFNGARFRRLALVSIERQPDRPYAVLLWHRGSDPGELAPMPKDAPSCFN